MRKILLNGCALLALAGIPFTSVNAEDEATRVYPERMMLLDFARDGDRLFAVGERGVIMKSNDDGKTLHLVGNETSRTLTKIVFLDNIAIAVGHGGTLLRSDDNGEHWEAIELDDTYNESFLGATTLSNGSIIIYGAFGMFYESTDKGLTWERREVAYEGFDWHISQIIEDPEVDGLLLLVAEAGTLATSSDYGQTWAQLESPYEGSLFGSLITNNGKWLIYGMRGNVYTSTDKGNNWEKIETNTINTLNTGYITREETIILGGNNGMFLISENNGESFIKKELNARTPISSINQAKDGDILYIGILAAGSLNKGGREQWTLTP